MKSKLILVSIMTLLISACGKTNNDVAFSHEKSSKDLASVTGDDQLPEAKTCESEDDLRAKGKAEFVCLYEGLNYTGQACCVARDNNARFVQVPDSNPRSRSAASLVHFGFKGSLGVVDTVRVHSDLELRCVLAPGQYQLPQECLQRSLNYGASFGIWGAINRLASYSDENDPNHTLHFFGIKTLVFELENLGTSAPRQ